MTSLLEVAESLGVRGLKYNRTDAQTDEVTDAQTDALTDTQTNGQAGEEQQTEERIKSPEEPQQVKVNSHSILLYLWFMCTREGRFWN